MTKQGVLKIIKADKWMMEVLHAVQSMDLPDWWIGAGFVRNKVWDSLHGYSRSALNDVDVIYFDPDHTDEGFEKNIEQRLDDIMPDVPWSVKNQARMALVRQDGPYNNAAEGLARWVETATCIGVRLDHLDNLELIAPHGIEDLVNLILRPTPAFANRLDVFEQRVVQKNWLKKWPKLKVAN